MKERSAANIRIVRYEEAYKDAWNQFNQQAKNGLFLFDRDYLEYHQDRFQDLSLLVFAGGRLAALLPLNQTGSTVASHGGLTFGGLIIGRRMQIHTYLRVFDALRHYLQQQGLTTLVYKPIPFIFHQLPALEDQYALYHFQARLTRRHLSACVDLQQPLSYAKGRKWALKKAQRAGLELRQSQDYAAFMALAQQVLATRHGVRPTHTAAEMRLLADRFPANIRLLAVYKDQELIGGSVVFLSAQVVHLQYIAISDQGRQWHALDLIVHELMQAYRPSKRYLSFGISPGTDEFGLNTGLVQNKESYGACSLPHDIYELDLGKEKQGMPE